VLKHVIAATASNITIFFIIYPPLILILLQSEPEHEW